MLWIRENITFRVESKDEAAQILIPNLQEVVTNLGFGVSETAAEKIATEFAQKLQAYLAGKIVE